MKKWAKVKHICSRIEQYVCALLYPHAATCPLCGEMRKVDGYYALCPDCMDKLEEMQVPSAACNKCLSPVRRGQGCTMCRSGRMKSIDACFSPFCYRNEVRRLVHQFKFDGDSSYIRYLSFKMAEVLPDREWDFLVPVPLSRERMWDRGVNQARLLAEALSQRTNIPVLDALERTVNRKPQSATPMEKRAENVKGVFRCIGTLDGLRILLIDDVRTTGSTAQACATEMKKAGAKRVGLCTLAVVYRDPKKFRKRKNEKKQKFIRSSKILHTNRLK